MTRSGPKATRHLLVLWALCLALGVAAVSFAPSSSPAGAAGLAAMSAAVPAAMPAQAADRAAARHGCCDEHRRVPFDPCPTAATACASCLLAVLAAAPAPGQCSTLAAAPLVLSPFALRAVTAPDVPHGPPRRG